MRLTHVLVVGLCACLGACGGDDAGGGGDGGSGSGSGDGSSSTAAASSSGGETIGVDGSGSSSASGDTSGGSDSSTGEPPAEVMISGEVHDYGTLAAAPIAGAEISVIGTPGVTATSDADGNFTLGPVPSSTELFLEVAGTAEFVGTVYPYTTGTTDATDLELVQVSTETVTMQTEAVVAQGGATADLGLSIAVVRIMQSSALSEGPVTVTMSPAPEAGTHYAADMSGTVVVDQADIVFSLLPVMVFFNVPEYAAGEVEVTATHPTRTCTVRHPDFITVASYLTVVEVDCVIP